MKTLLQLALASSVVFSFNTFAAHKTLVVEVTNINVELGGSVIVYLFNKAGFPKQHEQSFANAKLAAIQGKLHFEFDVPVPLSHLAIKVLHDQDDSNSVTKNWTGVIPAEGLGFSNNQKLGLFGPPGYQDCQLTLAADKSRFNHSIIVTYP